MLPTNTVPLSPRTIARAFGTSSAKTLIENPDGNLILSSGSAAAYALQTAATMSNVQPSSRRQSFGMLFLARFVGQRRQRAQISHQRVEVGGRQLARRIANDFFHRIVGGIAIRRCAGQQKF